MKPNLRVHIPIRPATNYPIYIDDGLLKKIPQWLSDHYAFENIVVITDHRVKKYYGLSLVDQLKQKGYRVILLAFPAGEHSKNNKTKQQLEQKMLQQHCNRQTLCLALGGGVVGDLTGFIAATFMRGIAYIQIPTTLLAMIDSSVGGKTAIDTPEGKNLIGAYWQPKAVIADVACLKTLPTGLIINGLIEAIKMFITSDLASFKYVQKNIAAILNKDEKMLKNIIQRAVNIKADIVNQDEHEKNLRMILNFGHTIGHALEKITHYQLLHGYAVAYGMLVEAKISEQLGLLNPKKYLIIQSCLEKLGIFAKDLKKYDIDLMIAATRHDKKTKAGNPHYVLLQDLGEVHHPQDRFAHMVDDKIVKTAFLTITFAPTSM